MSKPIQVRERRQKGFFLVDDEYMNGYAKLLPPSHSMVYLYLCRKVDKDQSAWPSLELIAKSLGINRKTVQRAIKNLEDFGMIARERKRTKGGQWLHTTYYLLDKSQWIKKPQDKNDLRSASGQKRPVSSGHSSPTKETQYIKETQYVSKETQPKPDTRNKDVQEIIDEMQSTLEGIPMDGTQKENRRYAYLLIGKLKKLCVSQGQPDTQAVPLAKAIIKAAHSGWHSKNATSVKYIYYNMGKIVNEQKSKKLNMIEV